MMKYYITKYALTKGILEVDCEAVRDLHIREDMLFFYPIGSSLIQGYGKDEWFSDLSAAIQDAEKKRNKKIASLQKQISKLEQMTFDNPIDEKK